MITLERVKEMTLETLKRTVRDGEDFMPVAFVNGPQTTVIGCPFTEETKCLAFEIVGGFARKLQATDIYLVVDSYIRVLQGGEDAKWVTDNWDIEKPTMYPKSVRQNALVINHIGFDGVTKEKLVTVVYDTTKDGDVILKQEHVSESFDGLLRECIRKGYDNPESIKLPKREEQDETW
jgi:hypothetical protein